MSNLLNDLPPAISPEAEQALLVLDRKGDIVLAALRPAFAYMKRLSRGKLPDDEILSAAYSALSKAIRNFKPGQQRFIGYARAYCRGELASIWRDRDIVKNSSRHETELPNDAVPQHLEPGSVEADFNGVHWREVWCRVEPHIRALPKKERDVIEFRYKFQMTYSAIGERLGGLSRERVRQIEQKALRKLRGAVSQ